MRSVTEAQLRSSKQKYKDSLASLYEIRKIRRKGRLAKYKTRVRRNKVKNGRPKGLFPKLDRSSEFKAIVKYFIEPLTNHPDFNEYDLSIMDRLSYLFCESTRDVNMAVVDKPFKMPGQVWDSRDGSLRWPTVNEAKIREGTPLFIRLDDTMPERIDVEIADWEKGDLIFSLTNAEYTDIVLNIKEVEGCNYKLNPPGKTGPYTHSTLKRSAR